VLAGYHEIAVAGLVVTVGSLSYLLVLKLLDKSLMTELWSYIVAAFHLRIDLGRLVSTRNQEAAGRVKENKNIGEAQV
jgi:hypothetical protein